MDNKHWNIYETTKDIYENVIQKGETFSNDMGKIIQDELEKMKKQRDEWLKNHNNNNNNNNNEKTSITNNSNS